VAWVGPVVMLYGTDAQKRDYLTGIASGEQLWCTLYSEPAAGSDLAALQTRAVRDGDDYVINGQKIWTTFGHYADWGWLAARTDPNAPKHKGISTFAVRMDSPGITVRPLLNMAGSHEFNEIFFEDVRVPAANLVGEENRGWYNVAVGLDFERSSIGATSNARRNVDDLIRYGREHGNDGTSRLFREPSIRNELADRYVEVHVARLMSYRVVSMQAKGLIPNHEASMTKLFTTELSQRIARTGVKLLGLYGQIYGERAPMRGRFERMYLQTVSSTIAGGTSEIQRNIIATRGLGLPRD
ncbi:MAG TPA: acyl-CoA dehydrogenase family protein, partial [Dehalococcoidia bacterium]|nr:acyl-CoA dehydrogenase family protein [Dehalococcoidia bacterium]